MTSRSRQSGQSIAEFIAVIAAIGPMFLLLPMIGKYCDLSTQTQLAARYVAFEATARNDATPFNSFKSKAQLEEEVRRRFFSRDSSALVTNAPSLSGASDNHLWRDHANNALLNYSDVQVFFGANAKGTTPGSALTAYKNDPMVAANLYKGPFGLQDRGLYTGAVQVSLLNAFAPNAFSFIKPFDALNLAMTRHAAITYDAWTGTGPTDVQARLQNPTVVPAFAAAGPLNAMMTGVPLIEMGSSVPPQFGLTQFWKDVVPKDRLQ